MCLETSDDIQKSQKSPCSCTSSSPVLTVHQMKILLPPTSLHLPEWCMLDSNFPSLHRYRTGARDRSLMATLRQKTTDILEPGGKTGASTYVSNTPKSIKNRDKQRVPLNCQQPLSLVSPGVGMLVTVQPSYSHSPSRPDAKLVSVVFQLSPGTACYSSKCVLPP